MEKEYIVSQGETLGQIARKLGIPMQEIVLANPGLNPDRINVGQVLQLPQQSPKKVNFSAYMADKEIGGNRNRPLNISAIEQFQDSLIARNFDEPQRLALLGTAAQEMDSRGAATIGVGGNGYLGLSSARMPVELLDDSPEGRGKQIHYILEDLTHVYTGTHSQAGNWSDGKSGGPVLKSGQDAYNKFWSAKTPEEATVILNKGYIRPRDRQSAWNNRASVAVGMQKYLYKSGGKLNYYKFFK